MAVPKYVLEMLEAERKQVKVLRDALELFIATAADEMKYDSIWQNVVEQARQALKG